MRKLVLGCLIFLAYLTIWLILFDRIGVPRWLMWPILFIATWATTSAIYNSDYL